MVTHITTLALSNKNMLLAASKWKTNSARIINATQGKVVGDWPTVKTKINFPSCANFNGNSDFMAIGSTNGFVNVFAISK